MSLAVTAHTIRLYKSLGMASKRRRIPRQASPRHLERDYARRLLELVRHARALVEPLLAELPGLTASARGERQILDSMRVVHLWKYDAGEGKRVRELMAVARERLRAAIEPTRLEQIAQGVARQTTDFNKTQIKKQTKAALGIDVLGKDSSLAARVEGFVHENVGLISDVPLKMMTDVENSVTRALQSGTSSKALAEELESKFGFAEDRAKLIARDQINKLYGQVNAARQQELGVKRFVWRATDDDRTRQLHRSYDGKTFSYDDPPEDGLPGEPINCRCMAEPVFADILDEI